MYKSAKGIDLLFKIFYNHIHHLNVTLARTIQGGEENDIKFLTEFILFKIKYLKRKSFKIFVQVVTVVFKLISNLKRFL